MSDLELDRARGGKGHFVMGRTTTILLIAVAAVGALLFIFRGDVSATNGPQIGKEAPNFTLTDMSGNEVSLSDFKGKVVLLNFFATWCPPCREEMPDVNAFYNENKSKDIVVLAIDAGQEDPAVVKDFMSQNGYTFPVLLDKDGKVGNLYRVDGIPAWFFIDKNGFIKSSKVGATSKGELTVRALAMQ